MGLTNTGYRRRTLEEIVQAKIAKARELFGENINTDENTALGKYIRINAYDQYNVEETAEKIYYSIFPQTATGQSLDRLAWSIGMSRNVATPAQYKVRVVGLAGEKVAFGFLVSTETQLKFYNTIDTVIGDDGTCIITVECVEAGTIGNVKASDICKVVNPVAYIDEVNGVEVEQVGTAEESDYDFLKRFEIVRDGKGSCNEASIISSLMNIPTVHGAYVVANEGTEEVDGIPPKKIACYVDGGNDYHQEIAEAIFDKKPIGVGTFGAITVPVNYGGLKDYEVNFSHSSEVDVYVKLSIITSNTFEEDGGEKIANNIVAYIDSLTIGSSLITTAMYGQIYSVNGVVSAQITASKNGVEYGIDDITMQPNECCSLKKLIINKDNSGDEVVYTRNDV